ncbi:IS21 family transposase [Polynucleobacter sphagniphilus]|jgi:transposase|nr:IS21 family transposase [Polynucleobacter sphagniphilus]MDH6513694.1 transposase [Polynucleobacter sphagniphilus]
MSSKAITMRKIKEVLRLRFECGLSLNAIARALELSKGAVAKYDALARAAQLDWASIEPLTEEQLAKRLLPPQAMVPGQNQFAPIDFILVNQEMKKKGLTLQLLWGEYCEAATQKPYGYTSFCIHYAAFAKTLKPSMRQIHKAGEKCFVDYAGPTIPIIDVLTGEITRAQIFVAVLGASSYTFALATRAQKTEDWLLGQRKAFEYFGGVTQVIVPDNPRSLVANPDRYEPQVGRSYAEFAAHYGCAVIPARPRKPQDKSKVEVGVQVVERWILARLRHQQFFSLADLNIAIAHLLEELNTRPFKKLPGNRRSAFEAIDKPALKSLPATIFESCSWKKAKVGIDYHVELEHHYYSVPYQYARKAVELRVTPTVVEILCEGKRIAAHVRVMRTGYSHGLSSQTTVPEHMPKAHEAHLEWSSERLLNWGQGIGAFTQSLVSHLLHQKAYPELAYRACLGLLNLSKSYGKERLEAACAIAVANNAMTQKSVRNILATKLDLAKAGKVTANKKSSQQLPLHENVRGPKYYH